MNATNAMIIIANVKLTFFIFASLFSISNHLVRSAHHSAAHPAIISHSRAIKAIAPMIARTGFACWLLPRQKVPH
jgi:hypothetical protein